MFAVQNPKGAHAVLITKLAVLRGQLWGEQSNGDTVVVIVRDGSVHTVMLRRHTQPFTREALRVDRCWKLKTGA